MASPLQQPIKRQRMVIPDNDSYPAALGAEIQRLQSSE
ncbi:hypothetical protein PI124_g18857 [Phytophthora idaei]|nr:hypothetical protein PI126_g18193 [Phytophthora idaei]KAG3236130.1 hypothetical protein PI124_g18857 [Phytophthora idaei]